MSLCNCLLCCLDVSPSPPLLSLCNSLLCCLDVSSDDRLWNTRLSLELLSLTEGWQWTHNSLIVGQLWAVLAGWAALQPDVTPPLIEHVVVVLGMCLVGSIIISLIYLCVCCVITYI